MSLTAQDHLDIQQLYAKYNHAIDSGKADDWAATFTTDGAFSVPGRVDAHGTSELTAFARGFARDMQGKARHWTNNLVIEPSLGGATGTCYPMLYRLAGGGAPPVIAITGLYSDVLTRAAGGWKFASRSAALDA